MRWSLGGAASVWLARAVFLGLLAGLCTPGADRVAADLSARLRDAWWFRLDCFEPALATASFAVWMLVFHACQALPVISTTRSPHMTKIRFGTSGETSLKSLVLRTAVYYNVPWIIFDAACPRRERRLDAAFRDTPTPSAIRIVCEVFLCLVLYDICFTTAHALLHANKWLYRRVHAEHHSYRGAMQPWDTVRVSPAEQVLLVLSSVTAVNVGRAHPVSRMFYNVVLTYLLTELHSGFCWPCSLCRLVPFGVWSGPPQHELHHRNSGRHMQKFLVPLGHISEVIRMTTHRGAG
jgi:Fatty acid hydroxylase